jgi:hypothetical protein
VQKSEGHGGLPVVSLPFGPHFDGTYRSASATPADTIKNQKSRTIMSTSASHFAAPSVSDHPNYSTTAPKRGSIIRNDPKDDDKIILKAWQVAICLGNIHAAIMLSSIIEACDGNLSPIVGAEIEVTASYLSYVSLIPQDARKTAALLNYLQSLTLITVKSVPDSKLILSESDLAFSIRLDPYVIELWLELEYGEEMPCREPVRVSGKNPQQMEKSETTSPESPAELTLP